MEWGLQIQRLGHDNEIPRRLIEAAAEVFARHGYTGTRVREIVRAADVNLASVNYYFGGKEGLYAATLQQLAEERLAQSAAPTSEAVTPEQALERQVLAILRRYVDGDRDSPLGRILAHESMNPTVYFERLIVDIVRPELDRLRLVVRAVAPRKLSDEEVMHSAMSILAQCVFYLFARGAVERLHPGMLQEGASAALARHISAFSLAALRGL